MLNNTNANDGLTKAVENHLRLVDGLFVHDKQSKLITFGGKATFDTGKVTLATANGNLGMRELSYRAKCYSPRAQAIIDLAIAFLKAKEGDKIPEDLRESWTPNWKNVDYKDLPFQGDSRKLARSIVGQLAKTQDSFKGMKITEKAFDSGKVKGLHGDVNTHKSEILADEGKYKVRARRIAKAKVEKIVTPLSTAQGNVFRLRQGIASLKAFAPESAEIAKLEAKLAAELAIVESLKPAKA